MIKNSFIPVISQKKKKKISYQNLIEEENTGSVEFQVSKFTFKIADLRLHLECHPKDYSSLRGFLRLIGKRKRLMSYLKKKNKIRYQNLIKELRLWDLFE